MKNGQLSIHPITGSETSMERNLQKQTKVSLIGQEKNRSFCPDKIEAKSRGWWLREDKKNCDVV